MLTRKDPSELAPEVEIPIEAAEVVASAQPESFGGVFDRECRPAAAATG